MRRIVERFMLKLLHRVVLEREKLLKRQCILPPKSLSWAWAELRYEVLGLKRAVYSAVLEMLTKEK